jgi:hypothetical protein
MNPVASPNVEILMRILLTSLQTGVPLAAALCLAATLSTAAHAAAPEKPMAGKQVHFPAGTWSAVPQVGPNGKVRQCVLVALRPRAMPEGMGGDGIETRFSLDISSGAGLVIALADDHLPSEAVLDDQAEIIIGDQTFPAVGFTVANSNSLASHPGDAAGVLKALAKAKTLRVRADGAGVDTGPIELDLPGEALAWLQQCGQIFNIAIDRPTDPDAPPMPSPRPRSLEIAPAVPTAAGPPGIEDKQKIAGWDASELRTPDGHISVCYIRQRYSLISDMTKPPDPKAPVFINALFVSRIKGLTMMLKNTGLNQPENQPVEATLTFDGKPFTAFSAHMLGHDEVGVFPEHGNAFAQALGDGVTFDFKSSLYGLKYPIPAGVVPWLRACARRNGISFEPASSAH